MTCAGERTGEFWANWHEFCDLRFARGGAGLLFQPRQFDQQDIEAGGLDCGRAIQEIGIRDYGRFTRPDPATSNEAATVDRAVVIGRNQFAG